MLEKLNIKKKQKIKLVSYLLMGFGFLYVLNSFFEFYFTNGNCFEGSGYNDDGLISFFFLLIGISGVLIYLQNSYFKIVLIITILGISTNILLNLYFRPFSETFILIPLIFSGVLYLIYLDKDLNFHQ